MELLLRKYLWAVDGLIVALCALFLARATATMIGGKMVVTGGPTSRPVRVAVPSMLAPVYTK